MSERLFTPTSTVAGFNNNKNMAGREDQVMTVGGGKTLDVNRYATKKTVAQGMLDIALLTANASQLKYVLTLEEKHQFYTVMLVLIITSLILQVMVGILSLSLTMLSDCRLHDDRARVSAVVINHINLISVFIIAVLNIIISGFGIFPNNVSAIRSEIY